MTDFTYNLTSSDDDILVISKIRLELGDTVEGSGIKPNGENFTDDELSFLYDQEDDSVGRAVAHACEILAKSWATHVTTERVGAITENYGEVSERWANRAKELREQYGGSVDVFVSGITRLDGYSEAADETDYSQ
jgi:hypothetical protein